MLMVKGGGYQANAWGLYDMQGNVAEWTSSDYLPYPYNEKMQGTGTEKVVRDGSWNDHPKALHHILSQIISAFHESI